MKNSRNLLLAMGVALLIAAAVLVVLKSVSPVKPHPDPVRRMAVESKQPSFRSESIPHQVEESPTPKNVVVQQGSPSPEVDSADPTPYLKHGESEDPPRIATSQGFPEYPQDPSFAWKPSFSDKHPWRSVDPEAPGHQLSFRGQIAKVVASQAVARSTGVALSVIIEDLPLLPAGSEPFADTKSGRGEESAAADDESVAGAGDPEAIGNVSAASATESRVASRHRGLTYEQQLFRTKWGWAAFDLMQKTLQNPSN